MAIGGSHYKGMMNNNGSRGRSYGLMLLLAFGAALFGVMLLHKLRERRVFTLLIKEKDHQLFSLHFLLQKEQECSKEMKSKNVQMNAKIYSIRTQKMELDRRLIEMQSTIESLKDEQKTMESALEEKQNEIKIQREVTDLGKENSQLTALKESLMQKEAEIEDLKRHLEYPAKVWSASTDDPSNPQVNLTNTLNMAERDKTDVSSSNEESGWFHMSTNSMAGENSTGVEDRSEKRAADTNSRGLTVEQIQKLGNTQDEVFTNGSNVEGKGRDGDQAKENDPRERDGFATGEGKNVANSTEQTVDDAGGDFLKQRDAVKDENGHTTLGKPENFQDENQDVRTISEGGMAFERLDSTRFQRRSRLRRHGRLTRTKGKRFRILAKNGDSEKYGLTNTRNRRFYRESNASNKGVEGKGRKTGENPQKERKAVESTQVKLSEVGTLDDSGYLINRDMNADPNQQGEQSDETLKSNDSPDTEMIGNKNTNGEITNSINEVRQSAEEASGNQQNMGSKDINEQENEAIQVKDGNIEDMEVADEKEPETEATDGDSLRESVSNLEES
ncbi:hypothetical protein Ddye_018506 [Dipteronia dyeriana]|uniref:Micronuclear linker histone polyprotein-like protein n=1 Tax=Dipteronia dyeriana TaxID=168575 RepID=A0AAD9X1Y5_9ROSI|nr:hypothetical protein Ddye_018506 [Dipteronia dyeriana]